MELDMGEKTTYLVMETHPAYVVLLDSEGRFLKAANCGYERGDRIDTAILIEYPQDKRRRRRRALRTAVSLFVQGRFSEAYQSNRLIALIVIMGIAMAADVLTQLGKQLLGKHRAP